jgi:hypothetical protein
MTPSRSTAPAYLGMPSQGWERLELEAAIAVLQQAEWSNGDP